MSVTTTSFTANSSKRIAIITRNRKSFLWIARLTFQGDLGSGTLALKISVDKGVTLHDYLDKTFVAVSVDSPKSFTVEEPAEAKSDQALELWGVLSGATAPNFNAIVHDNNL